MLVVVLVSVFAIGACGDDDGGGESTAAGTDTGTAGANLPDEFKVGANVALSGWMAPYDGEATDGLRMAIDEINAKGGIGGKSKIKLTVANNRTDAAEAAKVSQQMIDDGSDFVILAGDATVATPGGLPVQSAGLPMMTMLASTVTQRDQVGDFFFSNGQADTLGAGALAKFARDEGIDTAFTLTSPDSPWLDIFPRYFADTFEKLGGEIVGTDTFRLGMQDFGPIIDKIKALPEPPDGIMTTMGEPEFPALLKQLRQAGIDSVMLASESIETPAVMALGENVDGTVAVSSGYPTPGSPLEEFDKKFEEATGEAPHSVLTAVGYDAMYVIADAVERAGSTEPDAVRKALDETKGYQGVLGESDFTVIPGFPMRPLAVLTWKWDGKDLNKEYVTDISLSPEELPKPIMAAQD